MAITGVKPNRNKPTIGEIIKMSNTEAKAILDDMPKWGRIARIHTRLLGLEW